MNFQQMMILACMPDIKKSGTTGYFYFNYFVLRAHPGISDFKAIAKKTLVPDQHKYQLNF
jgi:hypothetical protein